MQSELMTLSGVSHSFHTVEGETTAIQNLDLTVYEGEFLAIVGPSGCGKTTVLSLMMGLISPTAGSVRVFRKGLSTYCVVTSNI